MKHQGPAGRGDRGPVPAGRAGARQVLRRGPEAVRRIRPGRAQILMRDSRAVQIDPAESVRPLEAAV